MKYYFPIKINYIDTDHTRRIKLHILESYLLEVAGQVASDLGFGTGYLLQQNRTWVLTSMSLEMQTLPTYLDELLVETWIEQNVHSLSIRDFRIYRCPSGKSLSEQINSTDKELIGSCKSIWTVIDLTERCVVNIFDQPVFNDVVDGEILPIDRAPRIRPLQEFSGQRTFNIDYSDIDFNGHCNSANYLRKMLDTYFPEDLLSAPLRLEINYQNEAHQDDSSTIDYLIVNQENSTSVTYQMKNSKTAQIQCMARINSL